MQPASGRHEGCLSNTGSVLTGRKADTLRSSHQEPSPLSTSTPCGAECDPPAHRKWQQAVSSGLIHLRSRRFNLQVTGCCSFESQGAVLLFVYFPLEACLLNNSIQQALLKPNLILWVLQGTGGDGKINRNKILFLLSGNFLSCQGGSQTAIQSPTPQEKKMVRIRKAKPTCPESLGLLTGS